MEWGRRFAGVKTISEKVGLFPVEAMAHLPNSISSYGYPTMTITKKSIINSKPRITLYSHDTMGLSRMRRNSLPVKTLAKPSLYENVLLIALVKQYLNIKPVTHSNNFVAIH